LILNNEGRFGEAETLDRQVVETAKHLFGPQEPVRTPGIFLHTSGLSPSHASLSGRRCLGPDHPDVLGDMVNLAATLQHEEKYQEAKKLLRETTEWERRC
jgi:hypothetical protein